MLDESKLQKGELKGIAKVLLKMTEGVEDESLDAVRRIADYLRRGQVDVAQCVAKVESDKLWSYPHIRRFIHDVIYPIGYFDSESGLYINEEK